MKKKFLSLLPALALMLSLLPAAAHHAHAEKGNEASVTIWTVMVDRVLVHKDGGLTFGFYNGAEIRVVL